MQNVVSNHLISQYTFENGKIVVPKPAVPPSRLPKFIARTAAVVRNFTVLHFQRT